MFISCLPLQIKHKLSRHTHLKSPLPVIYSKDFSHDPITDTGSAKLTLIFHQLRRSRHRQIHWPAANRPGRPRRQPRLQRPPRSARNSPLRRPRRLPRRDRHLQRRHHNAQHARRLPPHHDPRHGHHLAATPSTSLHQPLRRLRLHCRPQ